MILPEIKLKKGVFSSFYEEQISVRISNLFGSFYENDYPSVIGLACELLEGLLKASIEEMGMSERKVSGMKLFDLIELAGEKKLISPAAIHGCHAIREYGNAKKHFDDESYDLKSVAISCFYLLLLTMREISKNAEPIFDDFSKRPMLNEEDMEYLDRIFGHYAGTSNLAAFVLYGECYLRRCLGEEKFEKIKNDYCNTVHGLSDSTIKEILSVDDIHNVIALIKTMEETCDFKLRNILKQLNTIAKYARHTSIFLSRSMESIESNINAFLETNKDYEKAFFVYRFFFASMRLKECYLTTLLHRHRQILREYRKNWRILSADERERLIEVANEDHELLMSIHKAGRDVVMIPSERNGSAPSSGS